MLSNPYYRLLNFPICFDQAKLEQELSSGKLLFENDHWKKPEWIGRTTVISDEIHAWLWETFKCTVINIEVFFTVVNEKTKQILPNSLVNILNKKTNELISATTDDKGIIQIKLPRNNEFELLTSHSDYIDSKSILSTTTKEEEIKSIIGLNLIEVGSVLAVKDLNYDFEKWRDSDTCDW